MSTENIYIGNGRQKEGSAVIELVLDLNMILNAEITERDGKSFLKCRVVRRRTPSQWGHTHSVYIPPAPTSYNERLMDQQEEEGKHGS